MLEGIADRAFTQAAGWSCRAGHTSPWQQAEANRKPGAKEVWHDIVKGAPGLYSEWACGTGMDDCESHSVDDCEST